MPKLLLLIIGLFIGIFLLSPWIIFYFSLCLATFLIYHKLIKEKGDRQLLIKFFLINLFSRLLIGGIAHAGAVLYGNGIDIFGDGMAYAINGRWISGIIDGSIREMAILYNSPPNWEFIKDIPRPQEKWGEIKPNLADYQVTVWAYILGILYYIFGFKPVIGIMVNILSGTLLSINLYLITNRLIKLDYKMKITAMIFFPFFPSLFLWSITNARDISIIYLLSIFMLTALSFERGRLFFFVVPTIISLITYLFRPQMLYPMLFLIFLFIVLRCICYAQLLTKIMLYILFSLMLIYLQFFCSFEPWKILKNLFLNAIEIQKNNITIKGTVYHILPLHYYNNISALQFTFFDYLILIFKGWFHMLFEPLPHRISTLLSLSYYPQLSMWYFLLFFSVYGIIVSIQNNGIASLVIMLHIFLIGTIVSIYGGNVGTMLRMRDMITPFILIFSFIGIARFVCFPKKCHS